MEETVKNLLLVIIIGVIKIESLFGLGLDFGGYIYENFSLYSKPASAGLFGIQENNDVLPVNIIRARLRPTLNFSEDSRITMQYEADLLYSRLNIPMVGGSGMTNRQALDLHWRFYDTNSLVAQHFIDMLYFKQIFGFGELTFGRQVISWGVGRIWQPTDLFNPINPANFSKLEKDGADALSMKFYLGSFTDLEVVTDFRKNVKDYNYGGRFRTNFEEFDLSAIAGYFDRKVVAGGDFAGNVGGAGVRGEGIFSYSPTSTDSNYVRFILGVDYQFTSELYGLLEYQYNGRGTICKSCYDLQSLMKGEIQNVGLNYIAIQANYLPHPLVTLSGGGMLNMNDLSGYTNLSCTVNALQNLNVGIGGFYFFGGTLDEFWYYPSALYLSGQWFF